MRIRNVVFLMKSILALTLTYCVVTVPVLAQPESTGNQPESIDKKSFIYFVRPKEHLHHLNIYDKIIT